ncbi:MAG: IS1595 family transposase [Rhodopirellula sp.]|nr:IS1595 family transposase [Rhodopirellula sp.]
MKKLTAANYKKDTLYGPVARAMAVLIDTKGYVAPVDLLLQMKRITNEQYEDWRFARVPYLERVCSGSLGKGKESKVLVVIAAEEDGRGIGRIRMARIPAASRAQLHAFIQRTIEPGSVVHTDGLMAYRRLKQLGYKREITVLQGQESDAAGKLLPRVHRVASLLKRWLLGTHQGAVSPKHLDYYLDEFTFRFNRRTSKSRGKLFYRLLQQAVQVDPAPYRTIVAGHAADPSDHNL